MLRTEDHRIIYHFDAEEVWIEGWGENGLRVRATKNAKMPEEDWALKPGQSGKGEVFTEKNGVGIRNGKAERCC